MADLDTIKKLRFVSGASITGCKKALEQAGNDFGRALEILRRLGAEIAIKKSERQTNAGAVDAYIHPDRRLGVIIKIRTETDFVARNEDFLKFVHDIAMHVAALNPENQEELLTQPFIRDQSKTVADLLKENIAKFGENIEIDQFIRFSL
jgi:elongation factor Ts